MRKSMDGVEICEQNSLMRELMQGCELTRKLEGQLDESCPTDVWKSLVKSIIASLEKAMSVAISNVSEGQKKHVIEPTVRNDSPRSINDSPRSNNSNHTLKDQERREICKKRKAMPKWSRQVRVCISTGLEGPPEDGSSWRKYGQKDILGAKYPRCYYRCTHRHSQGCLATKHVQRSEEDPTVFEVTYRGEHSCSSKQSQNLDSAYNGSNCQILLDQVKTEDFKTEDLTSSFSLTPVNHLKIENYNQIFSPPSTPDNQSIGAYNFASYISPASFESSCFSLTPGPDGETMNFHAIESDLMDIISAATSTTNTPILGLDFEWDQLELYPEFPFDADYS